MPLSAESIAHSSAVISLTRRCMADKARLRRERFATSDDVYEFLNDLRINTAMVRPSKANGIFKDPAWEFTGLWTASRRSAGPRLIKMWRLRTPKERRRER